MTFSFDDIAFSGDIGRINPEEKEYKVVIVCPKMKTRNKTHTVPTMTLESCLIRIETKHTCTIRCSVANKLKGKK